MEGILRARKLRLQIEAFQQYRRMGITTLEQARQYDIDRRKQEMEQKSKKQREAMSYLFETGRSGSSSQIAETSRRARGRDGLEALPDKPAAKSSSRGGKAEDPMSLAPGADLLSPKELDLCTSVPLLPMHYLAVKEAVIR